MTRLRGAIVDWAGTIVDFGSSAPAGAFITLFQHHDVAISVAEARAPMGRGKRVAEGRPAPWMALEAARRLDVYPMRCIMKIGDTVADVGEGLNAGMWSIAVCATGNEMGLDEDELAALPEAERHDRLAAIRAKFVAAGAHYVVDGVADVWPLVDEIDARLEEGERP